MSNQDIFIGREKELVTIEELIFDPDQKNHVLPIIAKGGVGKTWLLRELSRRYETSPEVHVIRIDYSETRFQNLIDLSVNVIEQFDEGDISSQEKRKMRRKLSKLEELAASNVDAKTLAAEENTFYDFGLDLLLKANEQKRFLILSDTIEAQESLALENRVNQLGAQLKNAVIILAGRPTPEVLNGLARFSTYYGENWRIHSIHKLNPFSVEETRQYFNIMLEGDVDTDLQEKIWTLTSGKPVLLSFSIEWLKRNVELPDSINLSLKELQTRTDESLAAVQKQFESELVGAVRYLRRPIDWAVLYLSFLNRRFDPKILQIALETPDSEMLEKTLAELSEFVFIRKSMTSPGVLLHDEAERMITRHVWPVVDPTMELRKDLATRVIDEYYLPQIEVITSSINQLLETSVEKKLLAPAKSMLPSLYDENLKRRNLQIECLDYYFRISDGKGWQYLDKILDEAVVYYYSLIHLQAINQAMSNLNLDRLHQARSQLRRASILLLRGEKRRAADLVLDISDSLSSYPTDAIRSMIILGECVPDKTERGKTKLDYFKLALERAQAAGNSLLEAEARKKLGLTYRQQGLWQKAENEYLQVLQLLDPKEDQREYAATLNNYAFVLMLSGQPEKAEAFATQAFQIRKHIGDVQGLYLCSGTLGHISEALGDYGAAQRFHLMALDLATKSENIRDMELCSTNIARVLRRSLNFKKARATLKPLLDSDDVLVQARALCQASRVDRDEAVHLNQLGSSPEKITRILNRAYKRGEQALEYAQESGDEHLYAGLLLDLALLNFLKNKKEDREHIEILLKLLQERNFPLEEGRLNELKGDLAYTDGDYLQAFRQYLIACRTLAEFSPASFRQTLVRVRERFFEMPSDIQKATCEMLSAELEDVDPGSLFMGLKGMCAEEIFYV